MVGHVEAIQLGMPEDPNTVMASLISKEHQQRVLGFIESGLGEGAGLATGGRAPDDERLAFRAPPLTRGLVVGPSPWKSTVVIPSGPASASTKKVSKSRPETTSAIRPVTCMDSPPYAKLSPGRSSSGSR